MSETISRPGRDRWMGPLLIVLVVLLAYSNSFHGAMIFDDKAIRDNAEIRTLIPRQYTPVQTTLTGRPVLRFTFAVNYALGGLAVEGYHITNLLIHLAACLLLYGILRRTLQLPTFENRFEKSAPWLAAAAAMIWGVHPLNTQAVTYIVQRAESLASMFYLGVIYCLLRLVDNPHPNPPPEYMGRGKIGTWGVMAIVSAMLGMGCKEIVATVPLAALFFDWAFLAGSIRGALRARWPMYLGLTLCWIVVGGQIITHARGNTVDLHGDIRPTQYALIQLSVIASYLRLMVWPTQLVFDEDGWVLAHSLAEVGWAGRGVLLLAIVTLPTFWRWPRIGFAGVWFFLVLAPTSSFVPILTEIAAEHRMYLPMVGWISLAVIGGWGLARRWFLSRVLAGVLCVTIVATLAVLTFQRNAQFQTAESIWLDTISKRPNNGRAHYSLACVLSDEAHQFPEGSPRFVALSAEAAEEFRVALRSYRSFDAEIKEAAAMTDAGNLAGAEAMYDHLIFARPDSTGGWNLLRGQVRVRRQEWTMARDDFQTLVQDRPNDPEAHYLLAVALQQLNDPKAAAEFQRTLELSPGYKDAELRLMKVK